MQLLHRGPRQGTGKQGNTYGQLIPICPHQPPNSISQDQNPEQLASLIQTAYFQSSKTITRPSSIPPGCIPHPHAPAVTACPNIEDLLLHLSTLNPSLVLVWAQNTSDALSTSTGTNPTCYTRGVGYWEPFPTAWLIHRVQQHPQLSGQPSQHCLILTLPKPAHHLQWDSPQSTPWQTTG